MATPEEVCWERPQHTGAKHQVLNEYFKAWFPIMLHTEAFKSVTVFEGFSGPGEYTGGEEGSPLVAMRSVLERQELVDLGKPVRFCFLDKDERRVDHLDALLDRKLGALPANVTKRCLQGECAKDAVGFLDAEGAWGQPIFANLDPFDTVPLNVVERLAKNDASEVLITFMSDRLRRFAKLENLPQGDAMFGSKAWRNVQHVDGPEAREAFLVETYRATLNQAGFSKIAGFKLIDEGGRAFWLLYATKHRKGLEKMKDAMWKVDPIQGYRFRDPRDPRQGVLDLEHKWAPDLAPLELAILDHLSMHGKMSVQAVRDFTLFETSFREPHAMEALRTLIDWGQVAHSPAGKLVIASEVWPTAPLGEQAVPVSLFD